MEKQSDLLLDIQHLHTAYRLHGKFYDAADDINLTLKRNEILSIVGESGCGKSTIASSIIGLYDHKNTKVTGDILYNELNLVGLNENLFNKIRGNKIGMIFQDPLASLNPLMRVGDQVAETLYYHTDMNEKERHNRVIELFNQVGMPKPEETFEMYPFELSGGLRQRVVIAMAIACKPEIIIADEPTTALDVTIQAQILDLLEDIQRQSQSGIILITHDLGVVAETADQVAVMYGGQIVEKADVKTIFEHPLHPYTRSLLNSMPQSEDEEEDLHVIQGTVPSLQNMPRKGDRFAARIPWIPASAHEEDPVMHEVEPGHWVRCTCWKTFHFQDEVGGE
ncbi:ABC transporter ATP-binding protein [Lactobacillus kullabergensis]|uniref:ABC transporter ATP-binding protein n=1 Tax=Lactobacillus TaxID=1578 RepID=UPI0018DD56C7|nr:MULTISPECIES: ABC transporter ATP-binding protein [Lactobacillus]MBI0121602.1 ABC transporter ATP-binding protein [Lactobacillus sp. M0398]MBI0122281.1 ABC transporter ATP-binding protein [Lactobacillus sp. W8174]MBI0134655.1 ABC transporter ATP-binding protein [Lactobacillus sp. W8173]MCX0290345.1 ABC transporter ATP-binding protein [Lactobacillus kullabergensis]